MQQRLIKGEDKHSIKNKPHRKKRRCDFFSSSLSLSLDICVAFSFDQHIGSMANSIISRKIDQGNTIKSELQSRSNEFFTYNFDLRRQLSNDIILFINYFCMLFFHIVIISLNMSISRSELTISTKQRIQWRNETHTGFQLYHTHTHTHTRMG